MRFSIFLPLQMPRPWHDDTVLTGVREALEQAELADRLGYHCVWTQEHHFLEEYSHASAPEVLLAAISQRTARIRLGHGVMLMPPAYNHPVRAAERIAMLDMVSNGRVEWGMGASATALELDGFGLRADDKHREWLRGARGALDLTLGKPWRGDQGTGAIDPRFPAARTAQAPHPPLWMACASRGALRHAAELGMGALTFAFVDADEARFWVDDYRRAAVRADALAAEPNRKVAMLSNFHCDRDRDRAIALGREGAEFFAFGLRHYFLSDQHRPGETDVWAAFEAAKERPFVSLDGFGDPGWLARHFRRLETAGVDEVILMQQAGKYRHDDVCRSLELFAREVMPEFAERHGAGVVPGRGGILPARPVPETIVPPQPGGGDGFSLLDRLRRHAGRSPEQTAVAELRRDGLSFSYAALSGLVDALSNRIATRISPGDRVCVAGDADALALAGLLAVIAAGGTAVPMPAGHGGAKRDRSRAILAAARPTLVIGSAPVIDGIAALLHETGVDAMPIEIGNGEAGARCAPRLPAAVPLLLFTSGSTQAPKGVAIDRDMLGRALENVTRGFGLSDSDRILSIVPQHHVLGLIVHLLSAPHAGATCLLLDPAEAAADPLRWLEAVSEHRVTVSAAPNWLFAKLAGAKATGSGLDLSTWRVALCGGEPVQADMLRRFARRWRGARFASAALLPSYGLTEASGTVTAPARGGVRTLRDSAGKHHASVGLPVANVAVRIVDPASRQALPDGHIGEIWLSGPTIVAPPPHAPARNGRFARLDDDRLYFRTGDLGLLRRGELAVAGRRDDVIVTRGENVYPTDVEAIAAEILGGMKTGAVLACPLDAGGTRDIAILVEADECDAARQNLEAVRAAVAWRLGHRPRLVARVAPGRLPRTISGKLDRRGAIAVVAALVSDGCGADPACQPGNASVETRLRGLFAAHLGQSVDDRASFFALGGDSLGAAELLQTINRQFGTALALTDIVRDFTVDGMARRLAGKRDQPLAEPESRYVIDRLRDGDAGSAVQCLVGAFARLPMLAGFDIECDAFGAAMAGGVRAAVIEGLSLAVRDRDSGELVACGLCRRFRPAEKPVDAVPERMRHLLAVQNQLDRRAGAALRDSGELIHMDLLAVERQHEGAGLPERIIAETLERAHAANFAGAVVHAASPVVQQLLRERFEFETLAEIRLRDWRYRGERRFAAVNPQQRLILMRKRFTETHRSDRAIATA